MSPNWIFYHSSDFDGQLSAYLATRNLPTNSAYLIPSEYGMSIPWDLLDKVDRPPTIYMLDFSFPMSAMKRLASKSSKFIWIDHHKSTMASAKEADFNPPGVRDIKYAACELVWGFFRGNNMYMPTAVRLLGRYDVWDHSDPMVLPFQYFMRSIPDTGPENKEMWASVMDWDIAYCLDRCKYGAMFLQFDKLRMKTNVCKGAFSTCMFGYRTLAINSDTRGGSQFEGHPEFAEHQLFCTFWFKKGIGWTISLYSFRPDIDVGAIAKLQGGGGHQGAAGFVTKRLPEELQ